MSNRPSFTRSSSMVVNVGDPIVASREPSPRPINKSRTTSYHGSGSSYGTRGPERLRQSIPAARRSSSSSRAPPPTRTGNMGTVSNKATASSARTAQPSSMSSNRRAGPRGTPVRLHQGLQQTSNRNPSGHRGPVYRAEPSNLPQYRYSNPQARLPVAPAKRSRSRPPVVAHSGGRGVDAFGADHESQSLVRVGGSRAVYPRH